MILTNVRVERPEGTVIIASLAVQIDQATDEERVDLDGARAYDAYRVYAYQGVPNPPLRRRDVLFDLVNLDPETGAAAKYRVAGQVETFDGSYQAMTAQRVVGT